MIRPVGLFRRTSKGVGQKRDFRVALEPKMTFEARLEGSYLIEEIDYLIHACEAVSEDIHSIAGNAQHQRFKEQKNPDDHYRCISWLTLYNHPRPEVSCYIEHPDSKRLLPIVRAMPDQKCTDYWIVWVSNNNSTPLSVPRESRMYVSDEPDVAGKTIDEVIERYHGKNEPR